MLIAGIGLPGCGKSTLLRMASKQMGASYFCEPEEEDWPEAVCRRDSVGCFTGIHAFRALRVVGLDKAASISKEGGRAVVDSYYDKLCFHWLGRPGMEWLISPDDLYFANIIQTAWLDYQYLPDVDVLVLFEVRRNDWKAMVGSRKRVLDKTSNLLSTFPTQGYFKDAAHRYVEDRGGRTKLVRFANVLGDLEGQAEKLRLLLTEAGIDH